MSAKWLKWTVAIASVAAGAAAVIGKVASDKKREEELDEFLLSKEELSEYESVPSLTKDIQSWQDLDGDSFHVKLSFGFELEENAEQFQAVLAKEGLSSEFNFDECIVDIFYSEDTSMEGLNLLAATLEDACVEYLGNYLGFCFL